MTSLQFLLYSARSPVSCGFSTDFLHPSSLCEILLPWNPAVFNDQVIRVPYPLHWAGIYVFTSVLFTRFIALYVLWRTRTVLDHFVSFAAPASSYSLLNEQTFSKQVSFTAPSAFSMVLNCSMFDNHSGLSGKKLGRKSKGGKALTVVEHQWCPRHDAGLLSLLTYLLSSSKYATW